MSAVPFTDLAAMAQEVWPSVEADYMACLLNADYVGGPPVDDVRARLGRLLRRQPQRRRRQRHRRDRSSPSTALGIGAGDEVIVPANTFIGTAAAVVLAGARPRFADVSHETLLITPEHLEAASSRRGPGRSSSSTCTGRCADMDGLTRGRGRARASR